MSITKGHLENQTTTCILKPYAYEKRTTIQAPKDSADGQANHRNCWFHVTKAKFFHNVTHEP